MKIKKVIASNFGCLSGSYNFFDDRANVVVEENERGKSTLVAAILSALYGLPPSRLKEKLTEKETYQPWKGGSYRVQLEVEDDKGRSLRIDRNFGEGKVKVTDLTTNKDVTEEFRVGKNEFGIGERLLGISREVFLKTCLVRQLEVQNVLPSGEKSSDLVSKVQQIFDSSGGKATAAKAKTVLKEAVREYPTKRWKTPRVTIEKEIAKLKEDIAGAQGPMRLLIEEREKAAPSMLKLAALRKEVEELEARRGQLEYLTRKAEIKETEESLKDDEKNRNELGKLIQRKESLKQYADFPREKADRFGPLVGRLEELRKQRKEAAGRLAKLKGELEAANSKLKQFEGYEGLHEDFKTRLHDLSMELARLVEEADKKRLLLAEFEGSLRNDGYDLSEIDELHRRFSELTVEEKDLLRDSEARIPRIEADVGLLQAEAKRCDEELRAIAKPRKALLPVGAVLFLAGAAMVVLSVTVPGVAAIVAAMAAIGFAVLIPRLKRLKAEELVGQKEAAVQQRESLHVERDTLTEKLAAMAQKGGFDSVAELSEAFKRWGRLEDRHARLRSLRYDATAADEKVSGCAEGASDEVRKMRLNVPRTEIDPAVLRNAESRMGEYLNTVVSLKKAQESCDALEEDIRKLDEEGKGLRESARAILCAANLPQDLSPEEALPKLAEGRKKSEDFHRLAAEIPERHSKLLSPEKAEGMRQRAESLMMEVQRILVEKPEFASLVLTKRHSEYEEQSRGIGKQIEHKKEEKSQLFHDVQNVEQKYREEYPRLANELDDLKQTLDRTERFQKSISIAIETLEEISARSHARWAGTLNERTNEILKHLNPRCRELKFGEELSFTLVPAEGEQPKNKNQIEAQQSVGARHQIYLAVRLALTDYLSSAGVEVPVILDDPFATSDDDRFLSGMKFVCREFRKNHQVIILTCHRQRHSELIRQKAPELAGEMKILGIQR